MSTVRRLLNGIALATTLLFILPLADVNGHKAPSSSYFQQGTSASLSTSTIRPRTAYPFPGGQGDDGVDEGRDGAVSSHTTRVAPWTSSPMSGPAADPPIANFGVVEDGSIYRSAQPTEADLRRLLKQGFKSIVSFRRETGDTTEHTLNLGFSNSLWLNIEDETNPTDEQAERFLDFVTDPQNWPVLVHCKVGVGRTGTMSALIRYAIDGWPMEQALKESRLYRNGVELVPSQIDWLKRWAASHPPACHRPLPPQPN